MKTDHPPYKLHQTASNFWELRIRTYSEYFSTPVYPHVYKVSYSAKNHRWAVMKAWERVDCNPMYYPKRNFKDIDDLAAFLYLVWKMEK